ncbi:multidrug effflux MFS transporter [Chromobacterium sp. IIBBL 290-4]|uniref:multidrug effflux MFS transporter n=1 Tax=Chromobacterium sp. IIBBL 290-4 TaxID=2953890 RepID=UPI0020B78D3E|nr:multidrug effflux MFS transporter [Chromobacterium sp. IIBBL 290-4]UTH75695.1 multidrug effflux MFS transporter [Chromobacterium sp. IIBBL 290-4]
MSHSSLAVRHASPATAAAILLILFNPLGIDLYLPALPAMRDFFHADASASISVFVFSLGLGQLLFGPLADRVGRRPVALGGLLVYAASAALASRCESLPLFLVLRLLQGLGASASTVSAFTIIRDCFSGNAAGQRYSLLSGALNIVPALAPAFGGWLTVAYGWQACFLFLTVSALLAFTVLYWLMPETLPERTDKPAGPGFAAVLRHPAMLRNGACSSAALGLIISYVTLAPGVLIAREGLSSETFGLLFGGNALLIMAASFIGLAMIGRFGQRAVLKSGLVLMLAAGALLLILAEHAGAWHYMLPVAVLSVGFALTLGPAAGLAMAPFAESAGRASAILGCVQMLFASLLSAALAALPVAGELALGAAVIALSLLCLLAQRKA